jgi:hypothetical protein
MNPGGWRLPNREASCQRVKGQARAAPKPDIFVVAAEMIFFGSRRVESLFCEFETRELKKIIVACDLVAGKDLGEGVRKIRRPTAREPWAARN